MLACIQSLPDFKAVKPKKTVFLSSVLRQSNFSKNDHVILEEQLAIFFFRPFFFGHSAGLKIQQGAKMCAWEQTKHAVNYSVQTYQQLPVGRQTHLLQGSWGCETLLLSVPRHLVTLFPSLARELKLYRCPVASGFGRFEITYLTSESHSESYEERFSERLKPLLFYSGISFESPFPHAEVLSNAVQQVSSHRCSFAE